MKKKVVIIEDEVIIAENLRRIVIKLGYEVVAVANSYLEGVQAIERHKTDIYLIDINLKEGHNNGVKLAHLINDSNPRPIIYITSNADSQTVNEAKTTKPAGYIIKPFTHQTIFSTLEIAIFNHYKQQHGITVRYKGDMVKVFFRNIAFLKASAVYTEIHTSQAFYLHRGSLKALLKILPANFVQTHRSFIVNLDYIKSMNRTTVLVADMQIPVGRTFKEAVAQAYANL